ncbi:MAG: hypothetical protein ACK4TI_04555, partial [Nitrososphaerales archaeon]
MTNGLNLLRSRRLKVCWVISCEQELGREYTLTLKHFITEDNSNKIIGVGVGSAGCKIASKVSRFKTGIHHFYYLSC